MNEMPQFCPKCGAGPEGNGVFRLPAGFPINPECDECERRRIAHMRALGERLEYERQERFWTAFLGDPPDPEPLIVQGGT